MFCSCRCLDHDGPPRLPRWLQPHRRKRTLQQSRLRPGVAVATPAGLVRLDATRGLEYRTQPAASLPPQRGGILFLDGYGSRRCGKTMKKPWVFLKNESTIGGFSTSFALERWTELGEGYLSFPFSAWWLRLGMGEVAGRIGVLFCDVWALWTWRRYDKIHAYNTITFRYTRAYRHISCQHLTSSQGFQAKHLAQKTHGWSCC